MKKKSIRTLDKLISNELIKESDLALLKNVVDHFSVSITEQMQQRIDTTDPNDPIAKQFVPSIKESEISPLEKSDPIGDETYAKLKGITHRYPDRCLLSPIHICPVYCRFCFRKEKIGNSSATLTPEELEAAFAYILEQKEIWEVILTGGDPFILKPSFLKNIIQRLVAIDHVEIIRIHTRVPVVDSERINNDMLDALKCDKPVYVILHANHPREFTPEAIQACANLIDAGIPMLSQTVLIKDLNDNIETLSALMRCFLKYRIKPYYLHQCDLARGTQHFRTSIAKGQQLIKELRGRYSGLCQPTYVLDIPGGYGKVPLGPSFIHRVEAEGEGHQYCVEDYQGQLHYYSTE